MVSHLESTGIMAVTVIAMFCHLDFAAAAVEAPCVDVHGGWILRAHARPVFSG